MATNKTTGAAGQAAACQPEPVRSAQIDRRTLFDMLALAVPALDQAVGLAQMALAYMEDPKRMRHTEPLAQAFEAILNAAQVAADSIDGDMGRAGLDMAEVYGQDNRKRRMEAGFAVAAGIRTDAESWRQIREGVSA